MQLAHLNILAIGRNAEVMQVLERLLNAPEKWSGTGVTTEDEAIAEINAKPYHLVLLCAGMTNDEEQQLKERLLQVNPAIIFIRHQGGGSGLLNSEIMAALDKHQITITEE